MTNFIRQEFPNSDDWFAFLSEDRRQKVHEEISRSKKLDTFVDELLFTQFVDKVRIIRKSARLCSSKRQFKSDLGQVRDLRKALAHANDYAATRKHASEVCEIVRIMDNWIEQFGR